MPKNSEDRIVRRRADGIPPISSDRLAEIQAIRDEDIDYSDIPQLPRGPRLRRDENGRLPERNSVIRDAILSAMSERGMTTYALWKEAREHCPTITETAVGEFLKGQRSIGLGYIEALIAAAGLTIVRS
jgi:hypothetical protein